MTRRLVIGTRNKKKLAELQVILGDVGVEVVSADELLPGEPAPEETGKTFEDNARLKALWYADRAGIPSLADDSGLAVDALDGAPGVYSARYAGEDGNDAKNNAKLLEALADVDDADRGAAFHCVIAVARPGEVVWTTDGACRGRILRERRGDAGFGYDPLFFHEGLGGTFAELGGEAKAEVSHRGRALGRLQEHLPEILDRLYGPSAS